MSEQNDLDGADQWTDEEFAGVCDPRNPQYEKERARFILIYYDAYCMQYDIYPCPSNYAPYSYSWLI
jgi:hypothetical protein